MSDSDLSDIDSLSPHELQKRAYLEQRQGFKSTKKEVRNLNIEIQENRSEISAYKLRLSNIEERFEAMERKHAMERLQFEVEKRSLNVVFYGVDEISGVSDFTVVRKFLSKEFGVKANKVDAIQMVDCWRSSAPANRECRPLTVKFAKASHLRTIFGWANSKSKGNMVARDLPPTIRQGRSLMMKECREIRNFADARVAFPADLIINGEKVASALPGYGQKPSDLLQRELDAFDTSAVKKIIEEKKQEVMDKGASKEGYSERGRIGRGSAGGRGRGTRGHAGRSDPPPTTPASQGDGEAAHGERQRGGRPSRRAGRRGGSHGSSRGRGMGANNVVDTGSTTPVTIQSRPKRKAAERNAQKRVGSGRFTDTCADDTVELDFSVDTNTINVNQAVGLSVISRPSISESSRRDVVNSESSTSLEVNESGNINNNQPVSGPGYG